MKLMIVDDHAHVREFIRELLSPFVSQVCECVSGEEAIARCEEFKPDFVTMDLQMKTMSGFETTRELLARHPGAYVIMVTQTDTPALRDFAKQAGARHYVCKDSLAELRCFFQRLTQP